MSDAHAPTLRMTYNRAALILNMQDKWCRYPGDVLDALDVARPRPAGPSSGLSSKLSALVKLSVLTRPSRGYYRPGSRWADGVHAAQSFWDKVHGV